MAVLSRRVGYLFVAAPRTGCTAVGDILCKERAGHWFPEKDVTDADGRIVVERKHTTVSALFDHGLLNEQALNSLFVFTAVRNPFDSLLSLWVKKRTTYQPLRDDPDSFVHWDQDFVEDMDFVRDHTFSEWIERQYGRYENDGQRRQLYSPFLRSVDHVMRYERLQSDFDAVLTHLGCEPIEIPVINPTEGRDPDYRRHYTLRAREIIETVFAADLEQFGYSFDEGLTDELAATPIASPGTSKVGSVGQRSQRDLASELADEQQARQRAERDAAYWEREYRRVRNHPVVRVLVAGRRVLRAAGSRLPFPS